MTEKRLRNQSGLREANCKHDREGEVKKFNSEIRTTTLIPNMQESKEFLRPNHQQWKPLQAFLSLLEFISTKQPQEKGFYVGTQTPLYNYEVNSVLHL